MFNFLFYSQNPKENLKRTYDSMKFYFVFVIVFPIILFIMNNSLAAIISIICILVDGLFDYMCATHMEKETNLQKIEKAYRQGQTFGSCIRYMFYVPVYIAMFGIKEGLMLAFCLVFIALFVSIIKKNKG